MRRHDTTFFQLSQLVLLCHICNVRYAVFPQEDVRYIITSESATRDESISLHSYA
jgi:hypothetical protein